MFSFFSHSIYICLITIPNYQKILIISKGRIKEWQELNKKLEPTTNLTFSRSHIDLSQSLYVDSPNVPGGNSSGEATALSGNVTVVHKLTRRKSMNQII